MFDVYKNDPNKFISKQTHWTLGILNMRLHTALYLDSMNGGGNSILNYLLQYVFDEFFDKKDKYNLDEQQCLHNPAPWSGSIGPCPQQDNGCDCGVFVATACDCLSSGEPLNYTQADMPHLRRRICLCILRGYIP